MIFLFHCPHSFLIHSFRSTANLQAQVVSSDASKNIPFCLTASSDNQETVDIIPDGTYAKKDSDATTVNIPKETLEFVNLGTYRISQSMEHMPLVRKMEDKHFQSCLKDLLDSTPSSSVFHLSHSHILLHSSFTALGTKSCAFKVKHSNRDTSEIQTIEPRRLARLLNSIIHTQESGWEISVWCYRGWKFWSMEALHHVGKDDSTKGPVLHGEREMRSVLDRWSSRGGRRPELSSHDAVSIKRSNEFVAVAGCGGQWSCRISLIVCCRKVISNCTSVEVKIIGYFGSSCLQTRSFAKFIVILDSCWIFQGTTRRWTAFFMLSHQYIS